MKEYTDLITSLRLLVAQQQRKKMPNIHASAIVNIL